LKLGSDGGQAKRKKQGTRFGIFIEMSGSARGSAIKKKIAPRVSSMGK